jgi:hypothetical protein
MSNLSNAHDSSALIDAEQNPIDVWLVPVEQVPQIRPLGRDGTPRGIGLQAEDSGFQTSKPFGSSLRVLCIDASIDVAQVAFGRLESLTSNVILFPQLSEDLSRRARATLGDVL